LCGHWHCCWCCFCYCCWCWCWCLCCWCGEREKVCRTGTGTGTGTGVSVDIGGLLHRAQSFELGFQCNGSKLVFQTQPFLHPGQKPKAHPGHTQGTPRAQTAEDCMSGRLYERKGRIGWEAASKGQPSRPALPPHPQGTPPAATTAATATRGLRTWGQGEERLTTA